jgi:hypothetical protein
MNKTLSIIIILILAVSILLLGCGPKTYTLTITIEPADSGSVATDPSSDDNTFEPNTEVTLTATPASGYEFTMWTDDEGNELTAETDDTLIITMDSDKTVNAVFVELSTLSVTATPASDVTGGTLIVSTSADNTTFDEMINHTYTDTQFTATGTTTPGNYYIMVEDNNNTGDSCRVTVDSYEFAEGVTYEYEIDMNTGNVTKDDLGVGSLIGSGFVDCP